MEGYAITLLLVIFCSITIGFLRIGRQLNQLHTSMNSRLDQLLQKTGELARAEGFKAGEEKHLRDLKDAGSLLTKDQ